MTYYDEEDKPLTEKERSEIVMKVSFLGKHVFGCGVFVALVVNHRTRPVFNSTKGNLFI